MHSSGVSQRETPLGNSPGKPRLNLRVCAARASLDGTATAGAVSLLRGTRLYPHAEALAVEALPQGRAAENGLYVFLRAKGRVCEERVYAFVGAEALKDCL